MKRLRKTKGLVLLSFAVTAGLVLLGTAAGAALGGSGGPLAKSIATSKARLPHSAATEVTGPRPLKGVPAHGSYAFLLKLGVEPTGRAYESNLGAGRTAARLAATNQLAAVRAAQSRVIAALPSGSHVLYQMHAV